MHKGDGRNMAQCCGKIIALLLMAMLLGCSPAGKKLETIDTSHLLLLKNDRIELGVWREGGGRIVLLRRPGGKNVLDGNDSDTWSQPISSPEDILQYKWHPPFHGHIFWNAPQSQWWMQQNIRPDLKESRTEWPPDPWIERASNQVLQQSPTAITLLSPASPVTGLQWTKTYEITPDGSIRLSAEAKNVRKEAVQWGIWSNTRVQHSMMAYIPMNETDARLVYKFETDRLESKMPLFPLKAGRYFTFQKPMGIAAPCYAGKVGLDPSLPVIVAVGEGQAFIKTWQAVSKDAIAKPHRAVEMYLEQNVKTGAGVLELECHGALVRLEPGQTMQFAETWRLIPYEGKDNPVEHAKFIDRLIPSIFPKQ